MKFLRFLAALLALATLRHAAAQAGLKTLPLR
jgi:hypothetical protein